MDQIHHIFVFREDFSGSDRLYVTVQLLIVFQHIIESESAEWEL